MKSAFLKKDATMLMIDDIRNDCGKSMEVDNYWYVTVKVGTALSEFYLDEGATRVVCSVKEEYVPPEEHECNKDSDCDDSEVSTKDECNGSPRTCINTYIENCLNNDDYCPSGCIFNEDNDCPLIDQCTSDIDCTDSNRFTADTCIGTPKNCNYELKTCEELNGITCEVFEVCEGTPFPTSENTTCCNETCVKTESCEGVECPDLHKCVRGECYKKTCSEMDLRLCTADEKCTDEYFKDDKGITCCLGECRRSCNNVGDCYLGEICNSGYCIIESCDDIGGRTCNASTEKCIGEIERTLDNDECCLECQALTCEEREGQICDTEIGAECTKSTEETFDTTECCFAECTVSWCFDKPCAINQKCDEEKEKCVLKTCDEMEGITCDEGQICECTDPNCEIPSYITSDYEECCVGTCN